MVPYIPQISKAAVPPSDCLMSYSGHPLGESWQGYPSAEMQLVYFIVPAEWAILAYSFLQETILIMPYKVPLLSFTYLNGNINFFDIVAEIVQENILTLFTFIILDYELRMSIDLMKVNNFTLKRQEAYDIWQRLLLMQITYWSSAFCESINSSWFSAE